MSELVSNAVNLNNIKDYVKANVALQCAQLHAPRLAIQGAPGTGKSDILREICEENGWVLSVKYLSNMSLEQITGIPCKVESGSTAIWSKPELFNFDFPEYAPEAYMNGNDEIKNKTVKILLIDDFHLADKIMQKYLFQLLTYKSLNGYHLPENTAILLAGNRNTDRALANPIPAPVCNRLMFMEVKSDASDWLNNFAFKNGVRGDVTSFIYNHEAYLSSEPLESGAWASPRAWTYLSNQMDAYEEMFGTIKIAELKNIASGLIGSEIAGKFIEYRELFAKWNFEKMYKSGIDSAKTIIEAEVNKNVTDVYAVVSAGCAWLLNIYKNNGYDASGKEVEDAAKFLYNVFQILMLSETNKVRRSTRPLIVAGLKFLNMYQNSIKNKHYKAKPIVKAFLQCMKEQQDCDLIFFELIAQVFDMPLDKDEQQEIQEAKERLKYEF